MTTDRPCMNPASIIWPERDEPFDAGDVIRHLRSRDNGRPLLAQETRLARERAREIEIIERRPIAVEAASPTSKE